MEGWIMPSVHHQPRSLQPQRESGRQSQRTLKFPHHLGCASSSRSSYAEKLWQAPERPWKKIYRWCQRTGYSSSGVTVVYPWMTKSTNMAIWPGVDVEAPLKEAKRTTQHNATRVAPTWAETFSAVYRNCHILCKRRSCKILDRTLLNRNVKWP